MDKLIYTVNNTINNIYDNRSIRAQNLSNVNVPGYRKDLTNGSSGTAFLNNLDVLQSRGFSLGVDENLFERSPGQIKQTDEDLDISIRGDGYFFSKGEGEIALTRRGDMSLDSDGFLVNGTNSRILDVNLNPISVPAHSKLVVVDNGDIIIEPINAPPGTKQTVATIGMTMAAGIQLKKFPDGEIRPDDGSVPQPDQLPRIIQGYIEQSNVNIVDELVNSIEEQRQYDINIKMIASAKEIDEGGAGLMRLPS